MNVLDLLVLPCHLCTQHIFFTIIGAKLICKDMEKSWRIYSYESFGVYMLQSIRLWDEHLWLLASGKTNIAAISAINTFSLLV
jgi:hypothetical protein